MESIFQVLSFYFNIPQENQQLFSALILIQSGLIVFLIVCSFLPLTLPYGRYGGNHIQLNSRISWFIMELPSLVIPLYMIWTFDYKSLPLTFFSTKIFYLIPFMVHYFHRALIYPFCLGSTSMPLYTMLLAVFYTLFNAYLQSTYILALPNHSLSGQSLLRYLVGIFIFVLGMAINIHADHYLIKLSKNKKRKGQYFIPRGYLFEYISCPNFFGESLEWFGYAISNWTLCGWGFFFQTFFTIIPRGYHHHKYYVKKLDDYPINRRAVIPFIL